MPGKILFHAARSDNLELLNSVLHAQPPIEYDINGVDGLGNTVLHYACEAVATHVLDAVLDEAIDVDATNRIEGNAPLHIACQIENEEARNWVVHQLLDAGASTTTLNHAGLRPMDLVVGARAETPLGKELIQMMTMSQAENALGADDIAYGAYLQKKKQLTREQTTTTLQAKRIPLMSRRRNTRKWWFDNPGTCSSRFIVFACFFAEPIRARLSLHGFIAFHLIRPFVQNI